MRFKMRNKIHSASVLLVLLSAALSFPVLVMTTSSFQVNEHVVHIPWSSKARLERRALLTATTFHPQGDGPFPVIVLVTAILRVPLIVQNRSLSQNSTQIKEFLKRGFAVVVPIRRGYGATGGIFAEDYPRCDYSSFFQAGMEAARDLLATVEFATKLPFVKADAVVVGQSMVLRP